MNRSMFRWRPCGPISDLISAKEQTMKKLSIPRAGRRLGAAALLLGGATGALAHVTLAQQTASAGAPYEAAFRVGHACKGAASTTAISVRIPAGFTVGKAELRPGWSVQTTANEVTWKADAPDRAVPGHEKTQFVLRGTPPAQPGTLWFKVLQTCDTGSADWAEVPATDAARPEFPAARLDVIAGAVAPVEASGGWVRRAVPGQSGTGAFMTLRSSAPLRLVGASTPVAGVAEVHEMKMEGDTMKMRAVEGGVALPSGEGVELKPGGFHLMLMDLKQEIPVGASVPLVLRFVDDKGAPSALSLHLPVAIAPPGGGAADAAPMAGHQHKH